MKAIYIYPQDIGTTEWSNEWIKFIKKLGYKDGEPVWACALVCVIDLIN